MRRFVQEYPGILVSPAPASEVHEPTYKDVEELRVMGFMYEEVWRPIPAPLAPPKKLPGVEKFSPDPWDWTSFIVGLGIGIFVGLPIGRAILGYGGYRVEEAIRHRIER